MYCVRRYVITWRLDDISALVLRRHNVTSLHHAFSGTRKGCALRATLAPSDSPQEGSEGVCLDVCAVIVIVIVPVIVIVNVPVIPVGCGPMCPPERDCAIFLGTDITDGR